MVCYRERIRGKVTKVLRIIYLARLYASLFFPFETYMGRGYADTVFSLGLLEAQIPLHLLSSQVPPFTEEVSICEKPATV